MKAWHFTNSTLRDGSPIPKPGVKLVHDGPLVLCDSGYHASKRLIDALDYAPGHTLHRVECGGKILHDDDKIVAAERTILWSLDAEKLLREFARRCALDVIHLWAAPDVVVEYLKTGDQRLRAAASWAAAWAASWAAARAAARDEARDAARAAARAAARDAARDEARDAARAAARDAARAAAAWAAARAAAAWAAEARAAARDKQNRRLTSMVMAEHRRLTCES